MKHDEDGRVGPHTHKCPACDKRVKCDDHWCGRKKKYCDKHRAK
jgi:hypothetical protein